jgi:hypothetical protein
MLQRQRGLSLTGWLFVLILVFGAATLAISVIPVVIEFRTANSVLEGMVADGNVAAMSRRDFYDNLQKRLKLNNIREWPLDERVKWERTKEGVLVDLAYEERMDLFWNADLVLTFERHYEAR